MICRRTTPILLRTGRRVLLSYSVHFHRKYNVKFMGEVDPELEWTFEPVQDTVTVHAGEPALMFYKTYNKTDKPLVGIALYSVFPEDAGYYFSKVQCFCFNQQVLNGKEELHMPLYFYLEPEIDDDPLLYKNKDITILYKFYLAKNQDLAKWMENQQKWEFEQKSFLRNKRKDKLKEEGKSVAELENDDAIEKSQILALDPSYKAGMARPNDITQFKHA